MENNTYNPWTPESLNWDNIKLNNIKNVKIYKKKCLIPNEANNICSCQINWEIYCEWHWCWDCPYGYINWWTFNPRKCKQMYNVTKCKEFSWWKKWITNKCWINL